MPSTPRISPKAQAVVRKRNAKENASAVKSLKADNARRTAAMDTAAKAGIKLSGSRYADSGTPSMSKREVAAATAYGKTKSGKADAKKAAIKQQERNRSVSFARGKAMREAAAKKPGYTG
jgi:hypothetical protein